MVQQFIHNMNDHERAIAVEPPQEAAQTEQAIKLMMRGLVSTPKWQIF